MKIYVFANRVEPELYMTVAESDVDAITLFVESLSADLDEDEPVDTSDYDLETYDIAQLVHYDFTG